MAQPDLTSHHVNYLIWRYLQESGHGEAAVSLQRAWYPEPQTLPFARHIQTHALVSLVQKGLQYHELESSIDKEGNPITFTPTDFFFGPEPFEVAALKSRDEAGTDHPAPESADDRITNGHSPEAPGLKRKGETNGDSMEVDAGTESKSSSPIPDPVDGDGDVSMGADEVPQEPTLSTGTSVGVQISPAKAADLTPDTACLDLYDHVFSTVWRPGDPTMLVARGESFCSLFKLSSSSDPVQNKFVDLKASESYVSAVAWDGIGTKLAVASIRDMKGVITMYNAEGNVVDMLPDLPRMISGLHWAEHGPQLVIVASNEKDSELALWDGTQRPDEYETMLLKNQIYDLVWAGHNQIFACGHGMVYQCGVDRNIHLIKEYKSDRETAWTFIRSIETTDGPVIVVAGSDNAPDSESATIWVPTHDIVIENAHQEAITAIDIRPQSPAQRRTSSITGKFPITIASYSVDGTINVWNVDLEQKDFQRIHRFRLGPDIPALAGGFSPDGYALAAVSKDRLFIWNAERGGDPMAVWTAPGSKEVKEEADAPTNGQNGHAASTECALSWDPDGKKLAYGFGNKVGLLDSVR
ncbi:hypothetical protein N7466_004508 [Penicillium verhagenii]|uniref:uncharacterized protein n=1 Tax=Penicillium verhagenii TaxID=1562060 RepID=UPI0025459153|nr:uncharacterized protein N7466_004508 [Penicillium verhagenii]KAJ5934961.1 hypothetical protein N7466_004508 [Penicillium verhagenii]